MGKRGTTGVQENHSEERIKGYKGLKKIIPFYKANKGLFIRMVIILILSACVNFVAPILSANALSSIATESFDMAIKYAVFVCLFHCLGATLRYFSNYTYVSLDTRVRFAIRQTLVEKITEVDMITHDKTNSGVFIDRINDDAGKCSDVLIDIMQIALDIISNVGFLLYIAFLSLPMFGVLVVYIAVMWLCDNNRMKHWYKDRKGMRKKRELALGSYAEQIRGIRDVKSLNIRENTTKESGKKYQECLKLDRESRKKYYKKSNLIKSNLSNFFDLMFLLLGIFFIEGNWITLAVFIIVYSYYGRVSSVTGYIASIKQYATEGEIAASRIFEIIEDYPKEKFGDKVIQDVVGLVELNNINFAYEEDKPVLKNLSLQFKPNKITAIVGKSGSGKTTILNLLNKLYSTSSGEIAIDGTNINELSEPCLRSVVGVVTQTPYIFNCTIRENMLYVKPNATEEELIDAMKKAQIYDFVMGLENGLDSVIGENGVMLSGGQKQRLAIARVLLKGSKILMLDEATSALDNKSQALIVNVTKELKKDHTIIIVAHRLSTIVDADTIMVLDNGEIVAEGDHRTLMSTCKIYQDLYESEEEGSKQIQGPQTV